MFKASVWFGFIFIVALAVLNVFGALTSSSVFLRTICTVGALVSLALVVYVAWVFRKAARDRGVQ